MDRNGLLPQEGEWHVWWEDPDFYFLEVKTNLIRNTPKFKWEIKNLT